MRWLFAHGWGYDAGFWQPLRRAMGDPPGDADDRGYFAAAHAAAEEGPCLAVGHSLGVLRLLLAPPPGCLGIVAINGFDRFCGAGGVAVRVVDRMLARLDREPEATVREFRTACGDATPFGSPDLERLRTDLLLLRDGAAIVPPDLPLLALDGARDPILVPRHRATVFAGRPRETCADGGHLLPLTHPDWCAARIASWIRR